MDRSPGLGFKPTGRAFPPFGLAQDSGSMAAFVAFTVAGQQGNFTPFPLIHLQPIMFSLNPPMTRYCPLVSVRRKSTGMRTQLSTGLSP